MQKISDNIFILVTLATLGTLVMVGSFMVLYIRNQKKIFKQRQQLQQAQIAHQKELLQVVIESQEKERIRVGRDLHDDVGAAISSLKFMLEMYNPTEKDESYRQFINSGKFIIDKMLTNVRQISHNLSPATLTYYGLGAAMEEQVSLINQTGKLTITLTNDIDDELNQIEAAAATALYRVLEELLNNTMKHAKASRATISFLIENSVLFIEYADNGIGMDIQLPGKGMGMQNIESRLSVINAFYAIDTAPGEGFNIKIKYNLS